MSWVTDCQRKWNCRWRFRIEIERKLCVHASTPINLWVCLGGFRFNALSSNQQMMAPCGVYALKNIWSCLSWHVCMSIRNNRSQRLEKIWVCLFLVPTFKPTLIFQCRMRSKSCRMPVSKFIACFLVGWAGLANLEKCHMKSVKHKDNGQTSTLDAC